MRTDILTVGELGAYSRAHTAAALRYYKTHGSPAAPMASHTAAERDKARARAAAWHAEHDTALRDKCERAGAGAVRKIHTARVKMRDTYAALSIRDAAHLDILERAAAAAVARLAELEPAAPRKSTRATAPAAVPAPVVKLRKGSKLEPCTRHADYWQSLTPARRFQNAVEGGTSTLCDGGACTLTPGTDRYAADLVRLGPVTLAELNGYASREPAAELEPAPVTIHAAFLRRNGSVTETGPVCAHLTMHDSRDDVDTGPDAPADDAVTCHPCREILACLSPATRELEPAADVVPIRPDVDTTPAPDTVPAPMPAMTRAARKATRRELAAAMRAEGLRPEGEEWRRRCAAAGLPVPALEESPR